MVKYSPSQNQWEEIPEQKPEGKISYQGFLGVDANGNHFIKSDYHLSSFAFDRSKKILYVVGTADKNLLVASFDINATKWQKVMESKPETKADGVWPGEWNDTVVFMSGCSLAIDEVNQELLFIGGRTGNKDNAFVGHWAYSLEKKEWRKFNEDYILDATIINQIKTLQKNFFAITNQFRNIYFQTPDLTKLDQTKITSLTESFSKASDLLIKSQTKVNEITLTGWQEMAKKLCLSKINQAILKNEEAKKLIFAKKIDATLLSYLEDTHWLLDEATDFLNAAPSSRTNAGLNYDPHTKKILIFGGDHGDYLLGDTWLYDCQSKSFERVFPNISPSPRKASGAINFFSGLNQLGLIGGQTLIKKFIYFSRPDQNLGDVWLFDMNEKNWNNVYSPIKNQPSPALSCRVSINKSNQIFGISTFGKYRDQKVEYWLMNLKQDESSKIDLPKIENPSNRLRFAEINEYNPKWYDEASRPDALQIEEYLNNLPKNQWVEIKQGERPAPQRDWGTAVFDAKRDQWYYWTGGHMADPANTMSTYHPALNLWSIPYVPSYMGKGIDFNGRPDCRNHTYLNYALDNLSDKLICVIGGSTCVFDPEVGDFLYRIDNPFSYHAYYTKTCSTPKGVVVWSTHQNYYFGIYKENTRSWEKLPLMGSLPKATHGDEASITYDSKRDVLWLCSAEGYRKMSGRVWKYDMKSGEMTEIEVKNIQIGKKMKNLRESVYLPEADMILHNGFAHGGQIAFNPHKESWEILQISFHEKNKKSLEKDMGGVGIALMFDQKRDMVWAQSNSKQIFALKIDQKNLKEITPNIDNSADKNK